MVARIRARARSLAAGLCGRVVVPQTEDVIKRSRASPLQASFDHDLLCRDRRVIGILERLRGGRGRQDHAGAPKIASEPEALIAWFRGLGFELERIGLEAGPMSQWPYRKHISPPSSSAIGIPSIADALQNDHCPARRAPAPARRIWRGCRPERGVRPAKRSGTAISATGRGGNARRYGRHQRPAPCCGRWRL